MGCVCLAAFSTTSCHNLERIWPGLVGAAVIGGREKEEEEDFGRFTNRVGERGEWRERGKREKREERGERGKRVEKEERERRNSVGNDRFKDFLS